MRARLIASTVAVAVAAPIALAQSPHTLSGNMALVGDYRFRGLSQTYTQPAIQAGVEYAAATGAYGGGMRLERERQSVSEWRIARAGPVWRISLDRHQARVGSRPAVLLVSPRAVQHRPRGPL
ncbi:MAG: hypothetical protein DMD58_13725 [Gemmatimonadetes bacterium]|nr:MAG: hypothetical protein DMD58_13725 [Gemmatimonadota bacterium]